MHQAHQFLTALATVLGVAAVTTVLFRRLRQPVVLGYLLAGFIVGPQLPIPLVADLSIVQTLSELGVILLMFSLGLEFSLGRLAHVGPTAGVAAVIEVSAMVWLGFLAAQAMGWGTLQSVFAGALVAISSTTIVAKAFDELRVGGRLRELVVGILIVEDLFAILALAVLTAVASGAAVSADVLAGTVGRLALFLAGLIGVGLLLVPRAVRAVRALDRPETTLVASLGLCFGVALLAEAAGYSVALGAFVAGSLVSESGEGPHVERLVAPVRDVFAAVFFVSVGMLIDPGVLWGHAGAVAALAAVVVLGKMVSVSFGAFLAGASTRTAVQAGMSLAQIGEFSFIIAGLGVASGATGQFLYPVAVAVSALTTLTTPWLIRASGPVASLVDRRLPRPLQMVVALYASWLEQLRAAPRGSLAAEVRRVARALLVDAVAVGGLTIAAATGAAPASDFLSARIGLSPGLAHAAVLGAAAVLALPFAAGLLRNVRRAGTVVAAAALPGGAAGAPDLAAAPRRVLVVTLQLGVLLVVGLPLVAVLQPFLPGVPLGALLGALVLVLSVLFWRRAADLQGHVRAGAQVIAEALARQARPSRGEDPLAPVRSLLPGLGDPVALRVPDDSGAVGRTLAQLDLRGLTGATVLAVVRHGTGVLVPTAREALQAGDVLALAGSRDAVEAARLLLSRPVSFPADAEA